MKKVLILLGLLTTQLILTSETAILYLKSAYSMDLPYELRQLLPMVGAIAYEKKALKNFYSFGHLDLRAPIEPTAESTTEDKKRYTAWLKKKNAALRLVRKFFHLIPEEENLKISDDLIKNLNTSQSTAVKNDLNLNQEPPQLNKSTVVKISPTLNEIAHNIAILHLKKYLASTKQKLSTQIIQKLAYSKKLSSSGAKILNQLNNEDEYDIAIAAHLTIVWLIHKKTPTEGILINYIQALKENFSKLSEIIKSLPLEEKTKTLLNDQSEKLKNFAVTLENKPYNKTKIEEKEKNLIKKYSGTKDPKFFETSNWNKDLAAFLIFSTTEKKSSIPKKICYSTAKISKPKNASFSDCMETAIRNLVNMLAFDPTTKTFQYKHLQNRIKSNFPMAEPLEELSSFYKKYPTSKLGAKEDAHNNWGEIVSGLKNVVYGNESGYNLEPTTTNMIILLNYLLGLKLFKEENTMTPKDLNPSEPKSIQKFIDTHLLKILSLFSPLENIPASCQLNEIKSDQFTFEYGNKENLNPYTFKIYLNQNHGVVSPQNISDKNILFCTVNPSTKMGGNKYDQLIWYTLTSNSFHKNQLTSKTPYLSLFAQDLNNTDEITEFISSAKKIPEKFFNFFGFFTRKHTDIQLQQNLLLQLIAKVQTDTSSIITLSMPIIEEIGNNYHSTVKYFSDAYLKILESLPTGKNKKQKAIINLLTKGLNQAKPAIPFLHILKKLTDYFPQMSSTSQKNIASSIIKHSNTFPDNITSKELTIWLLNQNPTDVFEKIITVVEKNIPETMRLIENYITYEAFPPNKELQKEALFVNAITLALLVADKNQLEEARGLIRKIMNDIKKISPKTINSITQKISDFLLKQKETLSTPKEDYSIYQKILSYALPIINNQKLIDIADTLVQKITFNKIDYILRILIESLLTKPNYKISPKIAAVLEKTPLTNQISIYTEALEKATSQTNPAIVDKALTLLKNSKNTNTNLIIAILKNIKLISEPLKQIACINQVIDTTNKTKKLSDSAKEYIALLEIYPEINDLQTKEKIAKYLWANLIRFNSLSDSYSSSDKKIYKQLHKKIPSLLDDQIIKKSLQNALNKPQSGYKLFCHLIYALNTKAIYLNLKSILSVIDIASSDQLFIYTIGTSLFSITDMIIILPNKKHISQLLQKMVEITNNFINQLITQKEKPSDPFFANIRKLLENIEKITRPQQQLLINQILKLALQTSSKHTEKQITKTINIILEKLPNLSIPMIEILFPIRTIAKNLHSLPLFSQLQKPTLKSKNRFFLELLTKDYLDTIELKLKEKLKKQELKEILNALILFHEEIINQIQDKTGQIKTKLIETTKTAIEEGQTIIDQSLTSKKEIKQLVKKLKELV